MRSPHATSRPKRQDPGGRHGSARALPRLPLAIGAILLLAVAAWMLWPSHPITNLDSRGTAVIAYGDSLTAGVGAGDGEDYPARLSGLSGVEIVNAGVSGDTSESALRRLERDVLTLDPRIVLVGLGGNDFLRRVPIETTEENLRSIVRQIQREGSMVVLLGFRFPSLSGSYEKMYSRIAEEEGCLLVPDLLDGILTDPSLRSDQIHPNARGYALIAERIARPLERLIARADAAAGR
jgi:acyl-CoA thioesterase I